MGADELIDFLENGNITNSVNLPSVSAPRAGAVRVTVIHENKLNMIAKITDVISKSGNNIDSFQDKNRGEIAYSIIDCDEFVDDEVVDGINALDGVIKVRVIK